MSSSIAAQAQGVEIKATRWPKCLCGRPYGEHRADSPHCQGYRPDGYVEDLGTRAYRPSKALPLARQLACGMIWVVERRLQGWRERLGRV